jgi:hypothetical protein
MYSIGSDREKSRCEIEESPALDSPHCITKRLPALSSSYMFSVGSRPPGDHQPDETVNRFAQATGAFGPTWPAIGAFGPTWPAIGAFGPT